MSKVDEDVYEQIAEYQEKLHAQNVKRIRIGLRCVILIPLIFLFLLFLTESNKVIFLILWIVSLFMISAYLIIVEYKDYSLQSKAREIMNLENETEAENGEEDDEIEVEPLIAIHKIDIPENILASKDDNNAATASEDNADKAIDRFLQSAKDYITRDFREDDEAATKEDIAELSKDKEIVSEYNEAGKKGVSGQEKVYEDYAAQSREYLEKQVNQIIEEDVESKSESEAEDMNKADKDSVKKKHKKDKKDKKSDKEKKHKKDDKKKSDKDKKHKKEKDGKKHKKDKKDKKK